MIYGFHGERLRQYLSSIILSICLTIETKIYFYYEILICTTVAKVVSQLDHPVKCRIFNRTCNVSLHILLWRFAKENIISQIDTLQLYLPSTYKNCNVCAEHFELLNLDQLYFVYNERCFVTQDLATLLIESRATCAFLWGFKHHASELSWKSWTFKSW